jgi:hypothetical protein
MPIIVYGKTYQKSQDRLPPMSDATNPFHGIFISDSETATDLLYYDAIAKTVVSLIASSGEKPISIGVHGDWG